MEGINRGQGQYVFGLDIGTRSIVGTVGYMSGSKFHVVAQRIKEHETRAMLDGQIHDIGRVGETIKQVKEALEADIHQSLTEVCIAAAGRVLRTTTTTVEESFEEDKEITDEDVYSLCMKGVEKAYEEFQQTENSGMKFYCVGYTAMRYYMNGYQMGNLEGHKAKNIGVDLIATFLPDDVVDGLYKAVELAGLSVANLTLEPIAAIQVAIPEKFRMLNLALVDVGAGTSDVSITRDGAIVAYGMIPVAGDSLTELIVQHCLVDFEMAEFIKKASREQDTIEYSDILGLPHTISKAEIIDLLNPAIDRMTSLVAEEILRINGDKPVSAVFVVGGGGMISSYTDVLSQKLGIPAERVAIRGQEVMQNIVFEVEDAEKDSKMVTPIGICLTFYEQSNNFIFTDFNGEHLKIYDNGHLSVVDAAMQVAFPNEDLFPKRGQALVFTVNQKSRIVRGEQGEGAVITVNGENADMYTRIHSGDVIRVEMSTAGEAAKMFISKLPEFQEALHITVNGKLIELPRIAYVNDKTVTEFYEIQNDDNIVISNYMTVEEIANLLDLPLSDSIKINGANADKTSRVYENFNLDIVFGEVVFERNEEIDASLEVNEESSAKEEVVTEISETENVITSVKETDLSDLIEEASEEPKEQSDTIEEDVIHDIFVVANATPIVMKGKAHYVFVDIFDYLNFDLSSPKGRSIVTTLNGRNAEYMEELHDNDRIEVYWN